METRPAAAATSSILFLLLPSVLRYPHHVRYHAISHPSSPRNHCPCQSLGSCLLFSSLSFRFQRRHPLFCAFFFSSFFGSFFFSLSVLLFTIVLGNLFLLHCFLLFAPHCFLIASSSLFLHQSLFLLYLSLSLFNSTKTPLSISRDYKNKSHQ